MAREDKEILSYDVQLGLFGGKAASGVHNFPFSVTLPAGLPPSMTVSPILTVGAGRTEFSLGGARSCWRRPRRAPLRSRWTNAALTVPHSADSAIFYWAIWLSPTGPARCDVWGPA
ncbi:unnamed protein product [Ectocarpus sp. 6 AP-2014]